MSSNADATVQIISEIQENCVNILWFGLAAITDNLPFKMLLPVKEKVKKN
jgi:hypothetical protein